jgi:hypothetical protein
MDSKRACTPQYNAGRVVHHLLFPNVLGIWGNPLPQPTVSKLFPKGFIDEPSTTARDLSLISTGVVNIQAKRKIES